MRLELKVRRPKPLKCCPCAPPVGCAMNVNGGQRRHQTMDIWLRLIARLRDCHAPSSPSTVAIASLSLAARATRAQRQGARRPSERKGSARGHADRAVKPDNLAIQHRIGDDAFNQHCIF